MNTGVNEGEPRQPKPAYQPNERLRQARLRTPSPSGSGQPMSRQELAEAVNAYVYWKTGRVTAMEAHYVKRLELGRRVRPRREYREAFRAVLNAAADWQLGFCVREATEAPRVVKRRRVERLVKVLGRKRLMSGGDGIRVVVVVHRQITLPLRSPRDRL